MASEKTRHYNHYIEASVQRRQLIDHFEIKLVRGRIINGEPYLNPLTLDSSSL